jgi:hypothetical protein
MKKIHLEKIEASLRELSSTLHEQLIDTKLVTIAQWNETIAPKISRLINVINGLMPDSPTARTARLPEDYFD